MVCRLEFMQFTGRPDYFINPRITEFHYCPGLKVNKMIMLSALKSFFEMSHIFSELMLNNEITVEQEFYCVV